MFANAILLEIPKSDHVSDMEAVKALSIYLKNVTVVDPLQILKYIYISNFTVLELVESLTVF